MSNFLRLIPFFALVAAPILAANEAAIDGARQADDARVIAIVSANRAQLDAIFSDDLHYVHSTGRVDSKASYTDLVVSGQAKYYSIVYETRKFVQAAPGIVLETGRCRVKAGNASQTTENYLSFLSVWREENGVWRFLAWQSCHLAEEKR